MGEVFREGRVNEREGKLSRLGGKSIITQARAQSHIT